MAVTRWWGTSFFICISVASPLILQGHGEVVLIFLMHFFCIWIIYTNSPLLDLVYFIRGKSTKGCFILTRASSTEHFRQRKSINQALSNYFFNTARYWKQNLKKGRFFIILTCQEAVHAERDVVERDGWTRSRSIFCTEMEPEPEERQTWFNNQNNFEMVRQLLDEQWSIFIP